MVYMAINRLNKEQNERILVLAIDVDNDLYRKTKISGPLIGRVQNLNGATQLALADPEETDANAMFEAVKIYDELKEKGYIVNVATVTGTETEGYDSDREVARQIDLILERNHSDVCILVTDGASDNRVIPIIQSRIKINSVKYVRMKQSEAFENAYFTVLEKLKEPHYARIVFGIPAVLILGLAISYMAGIGWEPAAVVIGLYLVLVGFGVIESIENSFRGFGFSIEHMSFAFYLGSFIFLVASFAIGAGNYASQILSLGNNQVLALAYGVEGFMLLLPITLVLYLIGRIIDARNTKYIFREFKYGGYIGSSLILWVLIYSFVAWIIGQIYFSAFVNYTAIAIIIGVAISFSSGFLRKRVLRTKKLRGRLVVNELGASIGKVERIDINQGRFIINTNFGNPITYNIDRIVEVSDKVVIK